MIPISTQNLPFPMVFFRHRASLSLPSVWLRRGLDSSSPHRTMSGGGHGCFVKRLGNRCSIPRAVFLA